MQNINNKHSNLTREELLALAQRYFEATTTEEEEELLKQYVTTKYINDPAFEDVVATLSLAAYKVHEHSNTTDDNNKHFSITLRNHWQRALNMGIAAMLCITIGISGAIWHYQRNNQCIAYIDGKKTTDTEVVMKAMKTSINDISRPANEPTVETQINDIFNTIDE